MKQYLTETPQHIVVLKKIKKYEDANFTKDIAVISKGQCIEVRRMEKSDKGTPRLVTKDGYYITANEDFVAPINLDSIQGYITHAPKAIEIVKKCKLYEDVGFKKDPIKSLELGTKLDIIDIEFTSKLTPRLKTSDGLYVTANQSFVKVVK
ncbi:DUF5776 domain-containing protein [Staphylococcus warneri]|uniref:DUF5776 domain-containing protein n=1 Tax=Staphylococcus warneri TaxID=1292 RepID=UPI0032618FF7